MQEKNKEFIHISAVSSFSKDGIETPKRLAMTAKAMGVGLAITDKDNIDGWAEYESDVDGKPILGVSLHLDMGGDVNFYARNETGIRGITRILEGSKTLPDIWKNKEGIIAAARPGAFALLGWEWDPQEIFLDVRRGDNPREMTRIAKSLGAKMIADSQVWTTLPRDNSVLVAEMTSLGKKHEKLNQMFIADLPKLRNNLKAYAYFMDLAERGVIKKSSAPRHPDGWIQGTKTIRNKFAEFQNAADNTLLLGSMCEVRQIPEIKIPPYPHPEGVTSQQILKDRCEKQLKIMFGNKIPKEYRIRLDEELRIIGNKELADYFLIISDLISEASKKLELSDMGSSTGSLTAFLLGITKIDPVANNIPFERFINEFTQDVPDFDHGVDGQMQSVFRRITEDLGQELGFYVYRIVNFPTYQINSALRMLMRSFGFEQKYINQVISMLKEKKGVPDNLIPLYQTALLIADRKIRSGIKSTHASKVIFSSADIRQIGGYQVDRDKEGFLRIIIDKNIAKKMLNIDSVANNGLSQLRMMKELVGEVRLPFDKNRILADLFEGNTIGIPFIETPWLITVFKRLGEATPDHKFSENDITIALALSRPGVWPKIDKYLDRRSGKVKVEYQHPIIKKWLEETYGVIVFQDQALMLAKELGDLNNIEVEAMRKAISKNRNPLIIENFREKFMQGAMSKGLSNQEAWGWFDEIVEFVQNGYGFLKGHAMAQMKDIIWPLAVYKAYHPKEFMKVIFKLKKNHYFIWGQPKVYEDEVKRLGY